MAAGTSLGGQIRRARGRLGARLGRRVSQAELGQMIGRSRSAVNAWEKGRTIPAEDDLAALEEALGVTLDSSVSSVTIDPVLRRMIDRLTPEERALVIEQLAEGLPVPPPRPPGPGQPEGRHRRDQAV